MNSNLFKQRISNLRKILQQKRISLFLVSDPLNIYYLVGIKDLSAFSREAFLLIANEKTTIFLSPLKSKKEVAVSQCQVISLAGYQSLTSNLNELMKKNKLKTLAIEACDLRVEEMNKIEKSTAFKIRSTKNIVESLREIKDSYEIKQIRKACRITAKTYQLVSKKIKPGISEKQISDLIIETLKVNGADSIPQGFSPIVASGENSAVPHHLTSSRIIKNGDLVLIDFGCSINGYNSDMSRTLKIGKITTISEYQKVKKAVADAYDQSLLAIKNRKTLKDIDQKVKSTLAKHGYKNAMPHATGHGIGLKVHERPLISHLAQEGESIKIKMVIALEPAVYLKEKFGVRHEDTLLVTKNNIEILTK